MKAFYFSLFAAIDSAAPYIVPAVAAAVTALAAAAWLAVRLRGARRSEREAAREVSKLFGSEIGSGAAPADEIVRICAEAKEASDRRERLLEDFAPVLREQALLCVMDAEPFTEVAERSVSETLRQMRIADGLGLRYAVLLVRIEAISSLKLDLHRSIYSSFRKTLQFGCAECVPPPFEASFVWADHSLLAAVVGMPGVFGADGEPGRSMNETALRLQEQMTLLSEAPVVIAFSEIAERVEDLPLCFQHAKELIRHKLFFRTDRPYTYRELADEALQLSYEQRTQMLDQIRAGRSQGPVEMLESYFAALHKDPGTRLESVKNVSVQLAEEIVSAVSGAGAEAGSLGSAEEIRASILSSQTVHETADRVVSLASRAAALMQRSLQSRKDDRIKDAVEWIENNYNRDISLDDIAARMGLSATYAGKQLNAYTGMSVSEYVNKVRIEHAKLLLANTKMSCAEIGAQVGFRHPQSFVRAFRKYAGMTPGTYRTISAP